MFSYLTAADAAAPEDLIPHALPWIVEAGNPYYAMLFGHSDRVLAILGAWVRRRSSEVSISRVTFLASQTEFAGGFIALTGDELRKARRADSIALLGAIPGNERPEILKRLSGLAGIFPPVDDDEFYLSKFGLHPAFRGRGLAKRLLDRYFEDGKSRGYNRYRLEVHAGNEAAIRCYQSAGFEVAHRIASKDGLLEYYSMSCIR